MKQIRDYKYSNEHDDNHGNDITMVLAVVGGLIVFAGAFITLGYFIAGGCQ